jgi:hypothetical protein
MSEDRIVNTDPNSEKELSEYQKGFINGMSLADEETYKALKRLVDLKKWKNEFGKDEHYNLCINDVWEYAENVLKRIERVKREI